MKEGVPVINKKKEDGSAFFKKLTNKSQVLALAASMLAGGAQLAEGQGANLNELIGKSKERVLALQKEIASSVAQKGAPSKEWANENNPKINSIEKKLEIPGSGYSVVVFSGVLEANKPESMILATEDGGMYFIDRNLDGLVDNFAVSEVKEAKFPNGRPTTDPIEVKKRRLNINQRWTLPSQGDLKQNISNIVEWNIRHEGKACQIKANDKVFCLDENSKAYGEISGPDAQQTILQIQERFARALEQQKNKLP